MRNPVHRVKTVCVFIYLFILLIYLFVSYLSITFDFSVQLTVLELIAQRRSEQAVVTGTCLPFYPPPPSPSHVLGYLSRTGFGIPTGRQFSCLVLRVTPPSPPSCLPSMPGHWVSLYMLATQVDGPMYALNHTWKPRHVGPGSRFRLTLGRVSRRLQGKDKRDVSTKYDSGGSYVWVCSYHTQWSTEIQSSLLLQYCYIFHFQVMYMSP